MKKQFFAIVLAIAALSAPQAGSADLVFDSSLVASRGAALAQFPRS
jgi:hypothetical protein